MITFLTFQNWQYCSLADMMGGWVSLEMTLNSPVGISYMQYELKGIIESVNLNDKYLSGKFVTKFFRHLFSLNIYIKQTAFTFTFLQGMHMFTE